MLLTILGKRYDFRFVSRLAAGVAGFCDPPDAPKKRIRVRRGLSEPDELEVVIHECLHAAYWHHDEQHVEQFGADLAKILWRLGYRKHGN